MANIPLFPSREPWLGLGGNPKVDIGVNERTSGEPSCSGLKQKQGPQMSHPMREGKISPVIGIMVPKRLGQTSLCPLTDWLWMWGQVQEEHEK